MVRQLLATAVAAMALSFSAGAGPSDAQSGKSAACTPAGKLVRLPGLPEASGLAPSRSTAGRLWAHNDSGSPEIFGLDASGEIVGRVTLSGAAVEDWEAIASAPCDGGACLYVADIGDNDARRDQVTLYRVPEPAAGASSAKVDAVIRASYPDGAHDAEALLAAPDGTLYIVTKGDTGPVAVYRLPRGTGGGTVKLERDGEPLSKGKPADDARVTDGAISADGAWVVLRTRTALTFYRAAEFLQGRFKEAHRVDLTSLGEPQGEAVAFGPSNRVYVGGEGGGKSQPGTLATLSCTL